MTIFEERIRGRYLTLADELSSQEFSGFAVLALDCLLIETLEQFVRGVPDSTSRSEEYFISFLAGKYCEENGTPPFTEGRARLFYRHFRCGILHQGESKNNSRVASRKDAQLLAPADKGKGLVVNARQFHAMIRAAFDRYLADLRSTEPIMQSLQSNFRKKMDIVCRVPLASEVSD